MDTPLFEAYLTEIEKHFFLYLDDFDYSKLFDSIGKENISKIRIIYEEIGYKLIDKIIYNGLGDIPDFHAVISIAGCADFIEKILINDSTEIKFHFWDDLSILSDRQTINKIIEGQKLNADNNNIHILNQLFESEGFYYWIDNNSEIKSKKMDYDEFMSFLQNDSYPNKVNKLIPTLDISEEEKASLYILESVDFNDDESELPY